MANAIAVPRLQTENPFLQFAKLLPGVALLVAIGYAGKVLEQSIGRYTKAHHLVVPNIEYVLWAILIGLVIANTVGVPQIFRAGVATYEFWLKTGIVLLGSRFLLGDVLKLGGVSLGLVAIELLVSLTFHDLPRPLVQAASKVDLVARRGIFDLRSVRHHRRARRNRCRRRRFVFRHCGDPRARCAGAVHLPADRPRAAHERQSFRLVVGLAVDNTAEATAAGALYSDAAAKLAVLAKTTRNAMIGFVVLGYAIYWATKGQAREVTNKGAFLWQKFPKFVLGFLLISILATYQVFSKDQLGSLANLSRWAFLLTFAGVGLRTNLRDMKKQGLRPFAVGAIGEVIIAVFTLALVLGAERVLHF